MNNKLVIITGSSGFIGKNLVNKLLDLNYYVLGIDILSTKIINNKYLHLQIDLKNKDIYNTIINNIQNISKTNNIYIENIHLFHLAAKIKVDESMKNPEIYYENNTVVTLNILEMMKSINLKYIYFSSTAAVYNPNTNNKLLESDNINPLSIYGYTKHVAEQIIISYCKNYKIKGYIFRFFNVAGGKDTDPIPHHLIPILIDKYNKNEDWSVFGYDYDTYDGTCIRDYIHVNDIVSAFIKSINISKNNNYEIINLGSGEGYSVLSIMKIIKQTLKIIDKDNYKNVNINYLGKREGDPSYLVADINNAYRLLKWIPKCDINSIILDTFLSYL